MKTLILCDFDGTISKRDVGFEILNHFSKGAWAEIDDDFVSGRIGSPEAYRRIFGNISISRAELEKYVTDNFEVDPRFPSFLEYARDRGAEVAVVSDGFDFYIQALMKKGGISGLKTYSNVMEFALGGSLHLSFPNSSDVCSDCGTCKLDILKLLGKHFDRVIYVGDGYSDRCVIGKADIIFARRTLLDYCVRKNSDFIYFDDFGEVLAGAKKNLRHVLFDLDGTLVDSYRAIHESFNHAFLAMGKPLVNMDWVKRNVGLTLEGMFAGLVPENDVGEAVKTFRSRYSTIFLDKTTLLPDVKKSISSLAGKGIKVSVITNKLGKYARDIVDHLGLKPFISEVIGSGDGHDPKPGPDMILAAVKKSGVGIESSAYVGDSTVDIEAGRNAGMDVYAIPSGSNTRSDLAALHPRRVLKRLTDLSKPEFIGPIL